MLVSDWNQACLDRQEAAYHLQFPCEEASDDIDLAAKEIEQSQAVLINSFKASMLMAKDDWEPADEKRFKELVFSTFELLGPKHRPVSLRRMIDDGKLDLVESNDV